MVILFPISQLGCCNACSNVILLKSSFGVVRNGPPDPVRISRFISLLFSPLRHCQMALCSLSTGNKLHEFDFRRSFIIPPAITIDSLFDRATSIPLFTASMVGSIPEAPTNPFITKSTSFLPANSNRAFLPLVMVISVFFNNTSNSSLKFS